MIEILLHLQFQSHMFKVHCVNEEAWVLKWQTRKVHSGLCHWLLELVVVNNKIFSIGACKKIERKIEESAGESEIDSSDNQKYLLNAILDMR